MHEPKDVEEQEETPELLDVEEEPIDFTDEVRLAERGVFPQSREELTDAFDPYRDRASDFLWENY